ncbi:hypothetical protein JIP62_12130 [Brevundimonas vitis]|uniref:Lipoprotein n=1 Tax=Brevundimonas vitisensis TaxID=2800818 RepID=A0ABX7BKG4_9CAUL|nr:hypothetical protein [Brevundimonas vitisensis]QQQ18052.1 hypothetical protein JIP62_12130 [Brevundimonas vitisensis]
MMVLKKPMLAMAAVVLTLAACDTRGAAPTEAEATDQGTVAEAGRASDAASSPAPNTGPAATPQGQVPVFAALYPDAAVSAPATLADGADGPGGLVSFTTKAAPDVVVGFYKQRAETAGLTSISAMNQGEARAYAAASPDGSGASVQVVAAPAEDGTTSVQLSWSAGR